MTEEDVNLRLPRFIFLLWLFFLDKAGLFIIRRLKFWQFSLLFLFVLEDSTDLLQKGLKFKIFSYEDELNLGVPSSDFVLILSLESF